MRTLSRSEKVEVGSRLRSLRADRTITVLAEAYCISSGYWSKLERGLSSPSERLLRSIAHGEEVSYDWLAFGTGDPEAPNPQVVEPSAPYTTAPAIDQVVQDVYDMLSDVETREAVRVMAEKTGQTEVEILQAMARRRPSH